MTTPEATFTQAVTLHRRGRLAEAEQIYQALLRERPDYFDALHLLGAIALQTKRTERAAELISRAISLNGAVPAAHTNLGTALRDLDRYEEALASYDRAIALQPDSAEAYFNRGIVLRDLARHAEALASFDRAIALKPDYPEAYNNRGNALRDLKRPDEAVASYDRAIAPRPNYAEAWCNRGGALLDLKRPEDALASYDRAIVLRPDYAEAHFNRGIVMRDLNRYAEAVACFDRAVAARPDYASARFASCMAELPVFYRNEGEIPERRAAYERHLRILCDTDDPAALARGVGAGQPYYLPYQGCNDRDLQALYGAFVCRVMAARYPTAMVAPPPAENEPIRVGIVSGFFNRHSNWKVPIKGWLSQLDRRAFRIFGYHTSAIDDTETKVAVTLCDRFVQGPLSIDRWRAEILADAPHVLIYPEIGIDPVTAALAAQRLAAVQCNSWGHPDTSGFPTMDYYLSSDLMEPPEAQYHYTERLVRLPNLSVYCEPFDTPPVAVRQRDFGIRPAATVYWCCQSLFKYLPQHDDVFPRIALGVGDCQFVFIQHWLPDITELFRQRLARAFDAEGLNADDFCVFLPRLDEHEFLAAGGQCQVFLDSIGWSGFNTTMESLLNDLPIVTVNAPLMRGRHSMAILRMIGVTETIAETVDDYISIAVRLGVDVSWRLAVKAKIAAGKHRVHRDRACIAGLEQFLRQAVHGVDANRASG